jgi:hypothetical protein
MRSDIEVADGHVHFVNLVGVHTVHTKLLPLDFLQLIDNHQTFFCTASKRTRFSEKFLPLLFFDFHLLATL